MSHDDLKCKCSHPMRDHPEDKYHDDGEIGHTTTLPCDHEGCPCKDFEEDVGE